MRTVTALAVIFFAAPLLGSVTGVVAGPDGAPVANARVALFRPIPMMLAARGTDRDHQPVAIASGVTDQRGQFALNTAGAGLVDVHIVADGFAPMDVIVAEDEAAGTIALRRAAWVTGKITANGKPVANAFVLALPPGEGMPMTATTDADGRYRLPDPGVWAQALLVRHPEFAPAPHVGAVVDFALEPGQTIHGKVVDGKGHPVAGAVVDIDGMLTTKSGDDGTFTFSHAPKQFVTLRARAGDTVASTGFTSGSPVLRLAPGSRISGVVRDAGKHPLAGISIAAIGMDNGEMAVTDANGVFVIDGLKRGRYELAAYASSRYKMETTTVDAPLGETKHDFVAQKVSPIEVLVRDDEHKPVSGAAVAALMSGGEIEMGGLFYFPGRTTTDGRFRIWQELSGQQKVRLAAIKPGFPPAISEVLDHRNPHIEITIPHGELIAGTVTGSDKKPLAGVSVNPVLGVGRQNPNESQAWATTDDQGQFRGRLTTTTKALTFARKGYVAAQRPIEVSAAMKPLQVALSAGASIRGRVLNKDGSPAPEVMVSVGDKYTNSGSDGSFVVEELVPGMVELSFGRAEAGLQQRSVIAPADDVKLVLAATRKISGRVIEASSGAPVESFTVEVSSPANEFGMPQPFQTTNGEFTIEAPEGGVSLTVSAAGYAPSAKLPVDAASTDPMTIKLSHGRTLTGHVVDEKGQPVAGVTFRISTRSWDSGEGEGAPLTPADGSFEIRGIPLDVDTNVTFVKSGYVKQERKLRAGHDDATLEVTMTNGLTVTGHVLDKMGTAAAGLTVVASSAAHGAEGVSATTDESGAFRLEGLASARYDVVVERTPSGEHGSVKDVDVAKTHELTIRLEKSATAVIFGRVTGLDPADQSPSRQSWVSTSNAEGESGMTSVDAGGNYRNENAPAGLVDVEANSASQRGMRRSPKVTVELQPGAELRVDLAFPPEVAVRGHVTRGGAPLAGAKIAFTGTGGATAMSGADGGYQTALDPGEYDVSLSMDEKRLPFAQHVVVKQASELDFHIDAAMVSASVVDAESGEPVGGATVTLSLRGETHDVASGTTGRDGMASIEVQQGMALTVIASKSGYANASDDVTPSGNAAVTLKLLRTPGAVVRIVDVRDGRTLSGYVIARDTSGRVVASADQADPDGTVTLPVAEGSYRFSASAEGYGSHTVKASVPSSEVRVPLPRGGNLSLRSSRDVRGTARLIQPDGEEYVRCWCSGIAAIKLEGPITFVDRISPGSYVLEVTLRDGKPKQFSVSVIEGQTTIVPID